MAEFKGTFGSDGISVYLFCTLEDNISPLILYNKAERKYTAADGNIKECLHVEEGTSVKTNGWKINVYPPSYDGKLDMQDRFNALCDIVKYLHCNDVCVRRYENPVITKSSRGAIIGSVEHAKLWCNKKEIEDDFSKFKSYCREVFSSYEYLYEKWESHRDIKSSGSIERNCVDIKLPEGGNKDFSANVSRMLHRTAAAVKDSLGDHDFKYISGAQGILFNLIDTNMDAERMYTECRKAVFLTFCVMGTRKKINYDSHLFSRTKTRENDILKTIKESDMNKIDLCYYTKNDTEYIKERIRSFM